jgi:hypothetical protein
MVRKIFFATSFVCEERPRRTNFITTCPLNQRINCHAVDSDEDSIPESILDTKNSLSWDGDLDNPYDSEDDCVSDVESHIEHDNGIENLECPEHQDVRAAPNVPRIIRPTQRSHRLPEEVFVPVNGIKTWRNDRVKKM